ncbi:MAG: hypothetical protein WCS72_16770, partial [Deltaproteobacteria bacterium]
MGKIEPGRGDLRDFLSVGSRNEEGRRNKQQGEDGKAESGAHGKRWWREEGAQYSLKIRWISFGSVVLV